MADWEGLHNNLLYSIGKHLNTIESYDSFGAVCRSWRASAPRDKKHLKLKTLGSPLLMLPYKELSKPPKFWGYLTTLMGRESQTDMREFFNVSTCKIRKIFLPEATKKNCLSWKDWLFIFEEDGTQTSLLHLVSRFQIQLPNLNLVNIPGYNNLSRVVLSANPNLTSDFTVMILLEKQLYFYKSGNTSWTTSNHHACSMIYFNDYLYTYWAHEDGIVRCDIINGQNPNQFQQIYGPLPPGPLLVEPRLPDRPITALCYSIVEISKKCYIVLRFTDYTDWPRATHKTKRFEVYEANTEDGMSWTEIKNLGNKAIFLGHNSLLVTECTEINKCNANCIYFTDYPQYSLPILRGDGQDKGIYHLSDERVDSVYDEKIEWSKFGEPLWIGPSF